MPELRQRMDSCADNSQLAVFYYIALMYKTGFVINCNKNQGRTLVLCRWEPHPCAHSWITTRLKTSDNINLLCFITMQLLREYGEVFFWATTLCVNLVFRSIYCPYDIIDWPMPVWIVAVLHAGVMLQPCASFRFLVLIAIIDYGLYIICIS